MNLLSSGSSDTSTWVQVCLFHILTNTHITSPARWSPRAQWCQQWCKRQLPTQAAQWSIRTSEDQAFTFLFFRSTLHLVMVSSFGILSRDPHRVSDDGAKGAANVGEGEEHRLLWCWHPPESHQPIRAGSKSFPKNKQSGNVRDTTSPSHLDTRGLRAGNDAASRAPWDNLQIWDNHLIWDNHHIFFKKSDLDPESGLPFVMSPEPIWRQ